MRKSFNTALTPCGALYFHELIVEARNSAFCRTRVAWCIPSSKTYLPRRLRATFHNVPSMFPGGSVMPPGNQNEGEDTAPLRGCYRCTEHFIRWLPPFPSSSLLTSFILLPSDNSGFSCVSSLDDSFTHSRCTYLENHRNINHFASSGCASFFYALSASYRFSFSIKNTHTHTHKTQSLITGTTSTIGNCN